VPGIRSIPHFRRANSRLLRGGIDFRYFVERWGAIACLDFLGGESTKGEKCGLARLTLIPQARLDIVIVLFIGYSVFHSKETISVRWKANNLPGRSGRERCLSARERAPVA